MQATLDLYPETETETVVIAGRTVPLEQEPSAALAWGLQESPIWERELKGFFGSVFQVGAKNQLVSLSPHRFGQIPVVFVHGTASSAGRWAEMINVLQGDPAIRDRYDFWGVLVRHRQPDPLLVDDPARRPHQRREASRPRGKGPGAPADGRDRPQPGRPADEDDGRRTRKPVLRCRVQEAHRSARHLRRDAGDRAPVDVRRGAAIRQAGDLHLHATPRELPGGERVRQKPRPAARQPAGAPGEGHRRAPGESRGARRDRGGEPLAHRGGQHVAAQPVHQDAVDHPHRPRGGGPLDHPRQGHRARRAGGRRRREVRERAHRRREVRAGGEMGALGPGSARGHPGGAADPARARPPSDARLLLAPRRRRRPRGPGRGRDDRLGRRGDLLLGSPGGSAASRAGDRLRRRDGPGVSSAAPPAPHARGLSRRVRLARGVVAQHPRLQ